MADDVTTPQNIPLSILIDGIRTNDPQLLDTLRAIEFDSTNTQKRLQDLTINFNTTRNTIVSRTRWSPIFMLMGG
jgi:hypothetical protein